jgi:hypothetical protein
VKLEAPIVSIQFLLSGEVVSAVLLAASAHDKSIRSSSIFVASGLLGNKPRYNRCSCPGFENEQLMRFHGTSLLKTEPRGRCVPSCVFWEVHLAPELCVAKRCELVNDLILFAGCLFRDSLLEFNLLFFTQFLKLLNLIGGKKGFDLLIGGPYYFFQAV